MLIATILFITGLFLMYHYELVIEFAKTWMGIILILVVFTLMTKK